MKKETWRLIESDPPNNGRRVLVWSKDFGFTAANYPKGYVPGNWKKGNKKGVYCGSATMIAENATHWRELPKPPE
jgi:hypothetical protein